MEYSVSLIRFTYRVERDSSLLRRLKPQIEREVVTKLTSIMLAIPKKHPRMPLESRIEQRVA